MDTKESLIATIVDKEWEMFQAVNNVGGRASCQDNHTTFKIMRISQAKNWPEAMLESYIDDLERAESAGRNLLSEKYARMMRSTVPEEYARIEHLLPPLEPETPELIEQIASIVMRWEEELQKKYPYILGRGRPLFSKEDAPGITSLETYLRGELATYSAKTLKLYLEHLKKQQSENINGSAITMLETMKCYGFNSLEEANEKLKARSS